MKALIPCVLLAALAVAFSGCEKSEKAPAEKAPEAAPAAPAK